MSVKPKLGTVVLHEKRRALEMLCDATYSTAPLTSLEPSKDELTTPTAWVPTGIAVFD